MSFLAFFVSLGDPPIKTKVALTFGALGLYFIIAVGGIVALRLFGPKPEEEK